MSLTCSACQTGNLSKHTKSLLGHLNLAEF